MEYMSGMVSNLVYKSEFIEYNKDMTDNTPESVRVLHECVKLQLSKSNDYQNVNSRVRQADYFPRGMATILDIVQIKVLRMRSVLEAMEHDQSYEPNFESLEDSSKDLINYASFMTTYLRGKMDGQNTDCDFLNRPVHSND
jgi:hypothetical protein